MTDAVQTAAIVEELAAMAWQVMTINPAVQQLPSALRDKHYFRKHDPKAYYGQK